MFTGYERDTKGFLLTPVDTCGRKTLCQPGLDFMGNGVPKLFAPKITYKKKCMNRKPNYYKNLLLFFKFVPLISPTKKLNISQNQIPALIFILTTIAVSYTHLDVYKRQPIWYR